MRTYGVMISEAAIRAGVAAMKGDFTKLDVEVALIRECTPTENYVADRTADKLLQRERKAGRIVAVNNRNWRALGGAMIDKAREG